MHKTPIIEACILHGGILGKPTSIIGLKESIKDINPQNIVHIPQVPYSGFFNYTIKSPALSLVTQYSFKDTSSLKIMIGHSMGADLLGRVYGYHGKYRSDINPIDPPYVDLLVLIFPLSREVKHEYIQKMSPKARRVLFIFLEEETSIIWFFRSYKRALQEKTVLPDNVRITKIKGDHAGGFMKKNQLTTKNVMKEISKEIAILCKAPQK